MVEEICKNYYRKDYSGLIFSIHSFEELIIKINFVLVPLSFPLLLWILHFTFNLLNIYPYKLGVYPRHLSGIIGVLTSPLIHSNYSHLISNTVPLAVMGLGIFYFYPKAAYKVFAFVYFCTGIFSLAFCKRSLSYWSKWNCLCICLLFIL